MATKKQKAAGAKFASKARSGKGKVGRRDPRQRKRR